MSSVTLSESSLENQSSYKVVLIGNTGTGKTTILLSKLFEDGGKAKHGPTIGVNCQELKIKLDKKTVILSIWDTAGQEVYHSIVPIYLRNTEAAVLVFDVTDRSSFQSLEAWRKMVEDQKNDDIPMFVVCNKIDLEERAKVDDKAAQEYAESIGASYHRLSALNGTGVELLFEDIAKRVQLVAREERKDQLTDVAPKRSGCC